MRRAGSLLVIAALVLSCASHQRDVRPRLPHPTIDDFRATIGYPYHAPPARAARIERAARDIRKGMTEAEVLRIAGPPDYKAPWVYHTLRGEVWYYVHTWEHSIEPGYHGKMVTIRLDGRVRPRIVFSVDATDFGVRRHE